nr:immunoglobulin light chain junction region [Macaca mulatta]MOX79809.1 immunoglobulin light chain junction region [Macaca mulatta]MOX82633.1 immunoglobulin light chain junction region [Macaca mulatta]
DYYSVIWHNNAWVF